MLKCGQRQLKPGAGINRTELLYLGQYGIIIGTVHHNRDIAVVLCGRSDHGGTANIDILDGVIQRALIIRSYLLERIQIHHNQVDG